MKRKIIQIATAYETSSEVNIVHALADDGTLWAGYPHWVEKGKPYVFQWEPLPGLPDDNTNLNKVR